MDLIKHDQCEITDIEIIFLFQYLSPYMTLNEKFLLLYFLLSTNTLFSAEAPLRKVSAGVKFPGRRRREPLPEATPSMAAIRGVIL